MSWPLHPARAKLGADTRHDGAIQQGNLTVTFSGKTDGEDWIDPELAAEYGRRILANLEEM